jgi:hypothetical protein
MHRLGADFPSASRPKRCPAPRANNPRTSVSRSVSSGKGEEVATRPNAEACAPRSRHRRVPHHERLPVRRRRSRSVRLLECVAVRPCTERGQHAYVVVAHRENQGATWSAKASEPCVEAYSEKASISAATVSRSRSTIWRPHARRLATLTTNGHQHSPGGFQPPNVLSDVGRRALSSVSLRSAVFGGTVVTA